MDTVTRRAEMQAAAWECQQMMLAFFKDLDERNYAGLVRRMHPEGIWSRQGKELSGEAQIMEAMAARSATLVIHHLLTNVVADVASDLQHASVFAYLLVLRHDDGVARTGPAPLQGIAAVQSLRADLRPTGDGWRIFRMAGTPTFTAA